MNIKAIRKKLGYTQNAFSKTIGIHNGIICRIERGQLQPPPKVICKIREFCDEHGIDFEDENESFVAWHLSAMYELKY